MRLLLVACIALIIALLLIPSASAGPIFDERIQEWVDTCGNGTVFGGLAPVTSTKSAVAIRYSSTS
jgi:hypothetical protein